MFIAKTQNVAVHTCKHESPVPEVIGIIFARKAHLSRTCKQASCLLHWLFVFKLAIPLFHFTLRLNRLYDFNLNTKPFTIP